MKCAIHPDDEAVGVCATCGKAVCLTCRTTVDDKVYCTVCTAKVYEITEEKRTSKPLIGGILGIIGGVIEFVGGIILVSGGLGGDNVTESAHWSQVGFGQVLVILGIIAVTGSSLAIGRKNFLVSVVGGVCAVPSIIGIPALVLIAQSREEFADAAAGTACPGCGKVNPKSALFCMVCGREMKGRKPDKQE